MAITVRCSNPDCGKLFRFKDDLAGKQVKCPGCGQHILVYAPRPAATVAAGAPVIPLAPEPGPAAPSSPLPASAEPSVPQKPRPQPQPRRAGLVVKTFWLLLWLLSLAAVPGSWAVFGQELLELVKSDIADAGQSLPLRPLTEDLPERFKQLSIQDIPYLRDAYNYLAEVSRWLGDTLFAAKPFAQRSAAGAGVLAGVISLLEFLIFVMLVLKSGRFLSFLCWLTWTAALATAIVAAGDGFLRLAETYKSPADLPASLVNLAERMTGLALRPEGPAAPSDDSGLPVPLYAVSLLTGGVALKFLSLINGAVAFLGMLGKGSLRAAYRWYALGVWLMLLAGILSGATVYAMQQARESPEWLRPQAEEVLTRLGPIDRLGIIPAGTSPQIAAGTAILVLCVIVAIFAVVGQIFAFWVMVYKLWAVVQDGAARTTPGKALGFLFIPLFNLYWMFVALPGAASELNRCLRSQGLDIKPAKRGWMILWCLLILLGLVPGVGLATLALSPLVGLVAF
ncbi:MAG: hypothetical protein NZ700_04020, partial [Gemmataceae bacterium]|nr:hypothetical protein [Gemmataceae bacterium]MDW8265436.1 hypothetical protein [Gemmataceae bacterium]